MADTSSSHWDTEIRRRLSAARLDPACEIEIARELAQHLDDRYTELRAGGLSVDDARRLTLEELNEEALMRRELSTVKRGASEAIVLGETRRRRFLSGVWQDVRYAVRVLSASRAFTAIAVLTLALGIGATTAIFSIVDAMLIRPLSYDPEGRLVTVYATSERRGGGQIDGLAPAVLAFQEWRARNHVFDGMALMRFERLTLLDASPVERVFANAVTPDFFGLFNAVPMLGRTFIEADIEQPVTIITYGCWQRRFGGSADAIGRSVRIAEGSRTIIGVLPPHFLYSASTDFWVPLNPTPVMMKMAGWGGWSLARLRPRIGVADAQREMTALVQHLQGEGLMSRRRGVAVTSLREQRVGETRSMLYILLAAVGSILLIGCVNVAGLLTARGAGRSREIAIRSSLGASRSRLVRQLLTEGLILALLGGLAGVLLARWTLGSLVPMLPVSVATDMSPAIDERMLIFTVLVSCATGVLFALWPALRLSRVAFANALKQGSPGAIQAGGRAGRSLVAVEVALAFTLLVAAGLMVRSLQQLLDVDPGFEPEYALAAEVSPVGHADGPGPRTTGFYRDLLGRLAGLPGVEAVGAIDTLPFWSTMLSFAELDGPDPRRVNVSPRHILPGYFQAMGIPIRKGRRISHTDDERAPCVAMINEQAVRQHWAGASPLGQRVRYGKDSGWCEIVGVVGDVRHQSLERAVLPELYLSALQSDQTELAIIVRAENPTLLVRPVSARLAALSEPVLVRRVVPFDTLVALSTAERQRRATLLSLLGGLGVLLACVGIFGLTGDAVARRTPEIGIRMALGANPARVLRTVMGSFVAAIACGIVLGLFGAWAATRVIAQYLFEVTPTDPLTLAAVSVLLVSVALLACYLPARRALRVDPVVALRAE